MRAIQNLFRFLNFFYFYWALTLVHWHCVFNKYISNITKKSHTRKKTILPNLNEKIQSWSIQSTAPPKNRTNKMDTNWDGKIDLCSKRLRSSAWRIIWRVHSQKFVKMFVRRFRNKVCQVDLSFHRRSDARAICRIYVMLLATTAKLGFGFGAVRKSLRETESASKFTWRPRDRKEIVCLYIYAILQLKFSNCNLTVIDWPKIQLRNFKFAKYIFILHNDKINSLLQLKNKHNLKSKWVKKVSIFMGVLYVQKRLDFLDSFILNAL